MSLFETGKPEFLENPEDRCAVVLLLDTSGSMQGTPIGELNEGLRIFKEELEKDDLASQRVEIATVTFGPVDVRQKFVTVGSFDDTPLTAGGPTPTGEAIERALDMIEERKNEYRKNNIMYYRPWMLLITDGAPTDEWGGAASRVQEFENDKKVLCWSIGVEEADMTTLKSIAPDGRPPLKLKGLQFSELFMWLSRSLSTVSNSQTDERVDLPSPEGWGSIEP